MERIRHSDCKIVTMKQSGTVTGNAKVTKSVTNDVFDTF